MSNATVQKITSVFRPQTPLWACEITDKHVIVAGVNGSRTQIRNKLAVDLPGNTVQASLSEANIRNPETARSTVKEALKRAGFEGSEISVVVPDDAVRIAFLTVDKTSRDLDALQTFIRWKLKKSVPFDVDSAQLAHQSLGPHIGNGNGDMKSGVGLDMLVTLSPRSIVQEYEDLFASLDIHAGLVLPSTVSALNLLNVTDQDTLFLKVAPNCITTTVFQQRRMRFYRRVPNMPLYDAVFPTVMYYQDKLGGKTLGSVVVCGYDRDIQRLTLELQEQLQIQIHRLEPKNIEDYFKPALGGVRLKYE